MAHLRDVDLIVLSMSPQPFDPNDTFFEVDRDNEAVAITPDVEDHSLRRDDARCGIEPLDVSGIAPACFAHLREPGIKSRFEGGVILVPRTRRDKPAESSPR